MVPSILLLIIYFTLKSSAAPSIFVIDLNDYKDTLNDYGPYLDYDYHLNRDQPKPSKFEPIPFEKFSRILKQDDKDAVYKGGLCTRLFRSIYGNEAKLNCLETLKERRGLRQLDRKPSKALKNYYNKLREKVVQHLSGFSQDYLDVRDLGRASDTSSVDFADDYLDVYDVFGRSNSDDVYCDYSTKQCRDQLKAKRRDVSIEIQKEGDNQSVRIESNLDSKENSLRYGKARFQVVYNEHKKRKHKKSHRYDNSDQSDNDYKYNQNNDYNQNDNYNQNDDYDQNDDYNQKDDYNQNDDYNQKDYYNQNNDYNQNDDSDRDNKYDSNSDNDQNQYDSHQEVKKHKHKKKGKKYANNQDTYNNYDKYDSEEKSYSEKYGSYGNVVVSENDENQDDQNVVPSDGDLGYSELSKEIIKKPHKKKKHKKGAKVYLFMQGNKFYDLDDNGYRRQRLTYFLPKRYFWKQEDLPKLGNYWFRGPTGRK